MASSRAANIYTDEASILRKRVKRRTAKGTAVSQDQVKEWLNERHPDWPMEWRDRVVGMVQV
jgi:hypothetical protein